MVLEEKDIKKIKQELNDYENVREEIIKTSRKVIKLSKKIIYATHKDDKPDVNEIIKTKEELCAKAKDLHTHEGMYRVGIQEYVEALCYYYYIFENRFVTHEEIGAEPSLYIMGVCDLTGELVRKAIYLAGKNETEKVKAIKDLVDEIYGAFLDMEFWENELRRKFDSVKYNLKKLEDLCLSKSCL